MPEFLEAALRHEARKKGFTGEHADKYVFGALNHIGAMHGNRETPKGAEMQAKHDRDKRKKKSARKIRVKRNRDLIPI